MNTHAETPDAPEPNTRVVDSLMRPLSDGEKWEGLPADTVPPRGWAIIQEVSRLPVKQHLATLRRARGRAFQLSLHSSNPDATNQHLDRWFSLYCTLDGAVAAVVWHCRHLSLQWAPPSAGGP